MTMVCMFEMIILFVMIFHV